MELTNRIADNSCTILINAHPHVARYAVHFIEWVLFAIAVKYASQD